MTLLIEYGNKFVLTKRYLFLAQALNVITQEVSLLVSTPPFEEFLTTILPIKRLKTHGYTILDTSEGQTFLHINHYGDFAKYGNLYISDSTGTRFSLSLLNNVRNYEGTCNFEKLEGLDGIYLANVFDQKKVDLAHDYVNSGKF